ncbi:hypothetical protein Bca52824_064800 [Brassica carinata]|uniref:Transmembrane protein n=1 Tax=Brassica carinata TaxID=52824 RepID=A0A8X7QH76_BRACI|nr:hypothetical protein Bca52824_064800 [Brassica carinata]
MGPCSSFSAWEKSPAWSERSSDLSVLFSESLKRCLCSKLGRSAAGSLLWGRVRRSGAGLVNRYSLSRSVATRAGQAGSTASGDSWRLRGLPRAVFGYAQSLRADHRASQLYRVMSLVFTAGLPFVASALFQLGCVLRLAACW